MPRDSLANNRMIRTLFARGKTLLADLQYLVDLIGHTFGRIYNRRGVTRLGGWTLDTEGGVIVSTSTTVPFVQFEPVWDDLRVPITALKLRGIKDPDFAQIADDGSGSTGVYVYRFDNALEEEVFFVAQMPHGWVQGSAIEPHVHWIPITNNPGDIVWGLEYSLLSVGESLGLGTTIITTTVASGGAAGVDYHKIAGWDSIDMTDRRVSTMLICRLFRDATNVADTYTGDAALLEFDFHYQIDSLGSDATFSKTTGTVAPTRADAPPTVPSGAAVTAPDVVDPSS